VPENATNWLLRGISFLQEFTAIAALVYLVVALRNVYKIKWVRASMYGLSIFVGYFVIFYFTAFIYLIYLLYQQQPA
jgi:hypothetical protein